MFSSEQKFNINGRSKENLKEVLNLALNWEHTFPAAYKIINNSFVFYWKQVKNSQTFPPNASKDTLVSMIMDFLKSSEGETEFKNKVKHHDLDGSIELGWQVYIPEYDTDPEGHPYAFLAVKHDWIYYHK